MPKKILYLLVPIISFFAATSGIIDSKIASRAVRCAANQRVIMGSIEMAEMDEIKVPAGALSSDTCKLIGLKSYFYCDSGKAPVQYKITEKNGTYNISCKNHGTVSEIQDFLKKYNSFFERSKRTLWAFKFDFILLNITGFVGIFIFSRIYFFIRSRKN